MKKLPVLTIILLILFGKTGIFAEAIKTTDAKVSKATVYLSGAQLTCATDFTAVPGINPVSYTHLTLPTSDQV